MNPDPAGHQQSALTRSSRSSSAAKECYPWSRASMAEKSGFPNLKISRIFAGFRVHTPPEGRLPALPPGTADEARNTLSGAATTTPGMAPQAYSPHSMFRRKRCSLSSTAVIGRWSSRSSWSQSTQPSPERLYAPVIYDNHAPQTSDHQYLAGEAPAVPHARPPTYSSWINQVERLCAEVTRELLQHSAHRSGQAREKDLRTWVKTWSEDPTPFIWTKTVEEIPVSITRYLKRIDGGDPRGIRELPQRLRRRYDRPWKSTAR